MIAGLIFGAVVVAAIFVTLKRKRKEVNNTPSTWKGGKHKGDKVENVTPNAD